MLDILLDHTRLAVVPPTTSESFARPPLPVMPTWICRDQRPTLRPSMTFPATASSMFRSGPHVLRSKMKGASVWDMVRVASFQLRILAAIVGGILVTSACESHANSGRIPHRSSRRRWRLHPGFGQYRRLGPVDRRVSHRTGKCVRLASILEARANDLDLHFVLDADGDDPFPTLRPDRKPVRPKLRGRSDDRPAGVRDAEPDTDSGVWSTGCGWHVTRTFTIPTDGTWTSGLDLRRGCA